MYVICHVEKTQLKFRLVYDSEFFSIYTLYSNIKRVTVYMYVCVSRQM